MLYGDTKERMVLLNLEKIFHLLLSLKTRGDLAPELTLQDVAQQPDLLHRRHANRLQ